MVGYKRFGVAIGIQKGNEYLLIRRADNDSSPGLWEFPGGKAEAGENYLQAATREIKEETNLNTNSLDYIGEYDRVMRDGSRAIHMILLHCISFSGNVRLSAEHSAYKWLDEGEIKKSDNIANDVVKFFELKIYAE